MSLNGDEKAKNADFRQTASSSSSDNAAGFLPVTAGVTNVDAAWSFLNNHRDAAGVDAVNIDALRRKIDWHIVPLMFLCYTMQFLDKVILNYAAVMGINKDLKLTGNDFSNVATFLFVGLLCFEIPNIYFLQVVPAAKWLGANVFLWGIATACGVQTVVHRIIFLVSSYFLTDTLLESLRRPPSMVKIDTRPIPDDKYDNNNA